MFMTREELIIDNFMRMMEENNENQQLYVMFACRGLDTRLSELIKKGMHSKYSIVRQAADNANMSFNMRHLKNYDAKRLRAARLPDIPPPYDKRPIGPEEPVSRDFEPPEIVYKRCIGGVIVLAEIPKDSWVRGRPGDDCRASKAIIKDVVGKYDVGISLYDPICYHYVAGDIVEIKDFDRSNLKKTTGFHFVCTLEEAQNLHL